MLVARATETKRLREHLAAARSGKGGVLVVTGEAGVGKTALLDETVDHAATGMRVVRVVGIEPESAMPYGTLFDVCRPFMGAISDLPEPQRRALEGALAIGPAANGDQFAIGAATLSLLSADSREAPLLLVIDDAHWVDSASAASLAFAFRRLDADDIAVVIGLRPEVAGGFDVNGFDRLEVQRLRPADAVMLARSRWPVSPEQAQRIADASAGNPLAVVELVSAATSDIDGLVPISEHIEQTFAARVDKLPQETHDALLVAAVDDLGTIDVLGRATTVEAFGPAEDSGLVRIAEGRLEFRHPLVRSAIYQQASPTERRAAHAALADALPQSETTRRVWHRASSLVGVDEHVAAALEKVALDAQGRSSAAAAAAAWRRAAELTEDMDTRTRRFLRATEAAWEAGASDAHQIAAAALAACSDPLLHADIVRVRARIDSQSGGSLAEASAALQAEADAVAQFDSLRAGYLLADAAVIFWPAWDTQPHVDVARAARRAAGDSEDPLFDYVLAWELARHGSIAEARELLTIAEGRAVHNAARDGDPRALILAGDCAWWRGDLRQACAWRRKGVDRARELGLAGLVARSLEKLADVQIDVGAWDEADAALSEAIRLGQDTGQLTTVGMALGRRAEIAARRGDADRFEHLHAAATHCPGTAPQVRAFERNSRCLLALGTGRPDVAIAAREEAESYSIEQLSANALDLIEAYIRAGRPDEARIRLDEVAPHVHFDEARGAYIRCRALLAAPEAFDAAFDQAVRVFRATGDVFEEARTRLCYGERLRRDNRRRDARRELGAALDTFEALRAASWADRTRRELRASGEHRRAQTVEARDDLTAQERQIAALAAEGRTNREIGALLFLSPRTIETHLGRVFRKLGIADRTALPAQLR